MALKSVELTKQSRRQVYWKDGELIKRINNVTKEEERGVLAEHSIVSRFSFRNVASALQMYIPTYTYMFQPVRCGIARRQTFHRATPIRSFAFFPACAILRDPLPKPLTFSLCPRPVLLIFSLLLFSSSVFIRSLEAKNAILWESGGVDFTKGLVN